MSNRGVPDVVMVLPAVRNRTNLAVARRIRPRLPRLLTVA